IVDYLNIISDARNRFERLVLEIYLQANARAVNAENQLATIQNDYDLLQQDLACEQQRQYNTKTDLNLMNIAYNNKAKEHHRWWFSYHDKNRQI
ncbi:18201_t:CDS:2, partial [Cetraspora pellucida]